MLSHLFRTLTGIRHRTPQYDSEVNSSAYFLHGRAGHRVHVAGASRHQVQLNEIVGASTCAGQQHARNATLMLHEDNRNDRKSVNVVIEGRIIGYLPAKLATQYGEWLHKWQLSKAKVQCNVVVIDRRQRHEDAARYVVEVEIDRPFKITICNHSGSLRVTQDGLE